MSAQSLSSRTSGHPSMPTSTVTDLPSVAGTTSGTVATRVPYSPMSSDLHANSTAPFTGFHRPPLPSSHPPRLSSVADVSVSQPSSGVSRSTFEHPGHLPPHHQQLAQSSMAAAMMDAQQYHQQQHHHHHPHHQFQMQIAARLQQRFAVTAAAAAAAAVGGGMPYNQAVAAAACGLLGPSSAASPSHMPSMPSSPNGVVSAGHLLSYLYARQQHHRQQQQQQQHHVDPRGVTNSAVAAFLGGGGTGLHNQHDEPKPTHSYIGIIAMAILGSKDRKLVLSDIYQWILDHYPYFRRRGPGWRNSIRHNLSLNDCFVKVGRSANGKGHYWAVHPANVDDFERGDFRRRRAQRKVRRAMGLAVPDDDDDSPIPSPVNTEHVSPHHGVHPSTTTTSAVLMTPRTTTIWPTSIFECSDEKSPSAINDDELDRVAARQRQPRFIENVQDISITSGSDHLGAPLPRGGSLSPTVFASSTLFGNTVKKRRMFDVESLLAPDVVDRKWKSPASPQDITPANGSAGIHHIEDDDYIVGRRHLYGTGNGSEHAIYQSNFQSKITFNTSGGPEGDRSSPWSSVEKGQHILNSDNDRSSQLAMLRRTEILENEVRSQARQDAAASLSALSSVGEKTAQADESDDVNVDGDTFDDEFTTASTTLDSCRRQRTSASKKDSVVDESDVQSPKKRHSVDDVIASAPGGRFETTTHNEVQTDATSSSTGHELSSRARLGSPDLNGIFMKGDDLHNMFHGRHHDRQQQHHQHHQPHQFQMQAAAVAAAWMARLKGSLLDPRVLLQLPQPMSTSSSHKPQHQNSKVLAASTSPVESERLVRRRSACDDLHLIDEGDVSIKSHGVDPRIFVDQHSGVAIKTEAI